MSVLLNPFRFEPFTPILRVQEKTTSVTAQDQPTIAATFDSGPIENNLIIGVLCTRVFEPAYSLTVPSGFTEAVQLNTDFATVDSDIVIFFKVAGSSESSTVTFTLGNDGASTDNVYTLRMMEWSGLSTSDAHEASASSDETSGTGLTAASGTTAATVKAQALAIACCAFGDDDFGAIVDGDWSNSFILQEEIIVDTASIDLTVGIGSKVLATTGVQNTTLTLDTGGAEERFSAISVFNGV